MIIKTVVDEDFSNYKKPSMLIGMPYCTFKCDKECGQQVCQNSALATTPNIEVNPMDLIARYENNNLTQAVVFGGLESFDSWADLYNFIFLFRSVSDDDVVVYNEYTKCEITDKLKQLKQFPNIIIKFGRYIPNQQPHYDEVLGVDLASDNQYSERIS